MSFRLDFLGDGSGGNMSEVLHLENLGEPVRKKGYQHFYSCPFHEDETGHLGVDTRRGIYHCFKCNASGKISSDGITLDQFKEKVERALLGSKEVQKEVSKIELPREYIPITSKAGLPYRYLINRRITDEMIHKYRLGYCSEGFFGERILIPIYDGDELVYFLGRTYTNREPKYLNAPVDKGRNIFKTFEDKVDKVIICEGVFDSISVGRVFPSISILGKVLNGIEQIMSIVKSTKEAYILLDSDAAKDSFIMYAALNMYIPTKVMFLEGKKDPGEMTVEELRKILP
jgi:DNA primase